MQLDREDFCPLIKERCKKLGCNFFIKISGSHPQTGDSIEEWDCTFKWLPILLIENSKEVRQGAAATESFRNLMFRLSTGEDPKQIANGELKSLGGS